MTIPASPTYTLPTWADSITNYPAGANPWNGTPIKVAPVTRYWTPNVNVTAEEHNQALYEAFFNLDKVRDSLVDIYSHLNVMAVNNWPWHFADNAGTKFRGAVAYNDIFKVWLMGDAGGTVYQSNLTGIVDGTSGFWLSSSSPANMSYVKCIVCDPGNGVAIASIHDDTPSVVVNDTFCRWNGTAWSILSTPATPDPVQCGAFVNGKIVLVGPTQISSTPNVVFYSSNASHTAMTLGTGIPQAGTTKNTSWLCASNGTNLMFAAGRKSMTSGTADAGYTTDGITWTTVTTFTPLTSGATTRILTGLAYDATTGVFIATVTNTSGGAPLAGTTIWTSSDCVTWTAIKLLSSVAIVHLACLGMIWAGVTTGDSIVYSQDQGLTWYTVPNFQLDAPTNAFNLADPGTRGPWIFAGTNGFMAIGENNSRGSMITGRGNNVVT